MSCTVNVPLGRPLKFPDRCPFSGAPSPTGTIRLKQTSNSLVIPLPGGGLNMYSTTTLRIPASRSRAIVATTLQLLMWLSLLGGMALTVWPLTHGDGNVSACVAFFLLGGPVVALSFRIARFFVLRQVRVRNAWNGFVEVLFQSDSYAREFSEMNRLALNSD